MEWIVEVFVTLRPSIRDVQGEAVTKALRNSLGFSEVAGLRMGKYFEMQLLGPETRETADSRVKDMCEQLLANGILETYRFSIREKDGVAEPLAVQGSNRGLRPQTGGEIRTGLTGS